MHEDAYRKKLMRVPNGLVFGIAEGFSRRFEIPLLLVRALWIAAACALGFLPTLAIYFALAIILPVGPALFAL